MTADEAEVHLGQRLSLKGFALTIRYIGHVEGKPGQWLGVEWDDPSRGKHDGSHDGHRYFTCTSSSATAASFLRPTQIWDSTQTFLEALAAKYLSEFSQRDVEIVTISGKQAEEVGFEKFARRQNELRDIHVLVLDHLRITHDRHFGAEKDTIARLCGEITELDISGNLFESFLEMADLCACLPRLRTLILNSNRPRPDGLDSNTERSLSNVRDLAMSDTLWPWSDLVKLLSQLFPTLQTLEAKHNDWHSMEWASLPSNLHTVDLEGNAFTSLSAVQCLAHESIRKVGLKHNRVNSVGQLHTNKVEDLDLGWNQIDNFQFFDDVASAFPSLKHLRTTGNPLYSELKSPAGQPLSAEDGYMLTIARLPQLETLNYSIITEKERLNAEVYYLNQIAAELNLALPQDGPDILRRHARWTDLCQEYGDPTVLSHNRQNTSLPPQSVLARAVTVTFHSKDSPKLSKRLPPMEWTQVLPKSCSLYMVLGIVGERLGIMPLEIRLFWETGELDPVRSAYDHGGPEWWDSDVSDNGRAEERENSRNFEWKDREVELTSGTRTLGTYVEGSSARVRIELQD